MTDATLEQKRAQYKQALSSALDRILAQLTGMPQVEKVILFGSYAAGRRDLFTDLDLLVVMDTDKDFLQRTAELYRLIQTDVDVDLLVSTPEELKSRQTSGFVRPWLVINPNSRKRRCVGACWMAIMCRRVIRTDCQTESHHRYTHRTRRQELSRWPTRRWSGFGSY